MAYSTGTAATIPDLLDAIVTFLNANGWTQDSYAVDGTGKRYHANRGGKYIHFRSRVNENFNNSALSYDWVFNQASSGLVMYMGSGYSGATNWWQQAGRPVGQAGWHQNPIVGIPVYQPYGSVNYHFFAHNSGDNIILTIEFIPNHFCHIAFGVSVDKRGQTYTGGEYFMANYTGYGWSPQGQWENTTGSQHVGANGLGVFSSNGRTANSYMRIEVDGDTTGNFGNAWRSLCSSETSNGLSASGVAGTPLSTAARFCWIDLDEYIIPQRYQANSPLNNIILLTPLKVYVNRTTAAGQYTNAHSFAGEIPKIFAVNIRNLNVGQQISIGGVNYRVFPMNGSKQVGNFFFTSPSGDVTATSWGSGEYGYAIAE